jgi:hypothetical protein
MTRATILFVIVSLFALDAVAQPPNQTPALLKGPADWRFEKMPVPPRFAPDIKLTGFEEARFAPGMFDTSSSNYFTYVLTLSVNGTEAVDAAAIKDFLDKYYKGLSAAVGRGKQLTPDLSQTNAVVTPTKASEEASSHYEAKLIFFDTFNDGRKVGLNLEIRVTAKPAVKKTFITLLISPQPPAAEVWKKLHEIETTINFEAP